MVPIDLDILRLQAGRQKGLLQNFMTKKMIILVLIGLHLQVCQRTK